MSLASRIAPAVVILLVIGAGKDGVCASDPVVAPANPASAEPQYAVTTRRDRIGRITASVTINGRGPFRFMIDTGSNHTVLAEGTLAKLGLTVDPEELMSVTGVSGSQLAPTTHISSLDAGDLHFHDLSLPVLGGPVFNGLDGILGMDGFDGMKVSADFVRDRLTISRSHNELPAFRFAVIGVEFLSERLLMVNDHVAGVRTSEIIDTGGIRTLGNMALLAALTKRLHNSKQAIQTPVIGVTPDSQLGIIAHVPMVELGPVSIADLDVVFGDFQIFKTWGLEDRPALLIGMDVLGTLSNLTIDYRRKELDLQLRGANHAIINRRWFSLTDF